MPQDMKNYMKGSSMKERLVNTVIILTDKTKLISTYSKPGEHTSQALDCCGAYTVVPNICVYSDWNFFYVTADA